MIKTILFDWGGVLIENPDHGLMDYCSKILSVQSDVLKPAFAQYEHLFQLGKIQEHNLWVAICEKLKINLPSSTSIWKNAVRSTFTDKPETYLLLKKLKQNDYKTGFLSNTEMPAVEYFLEKKYGQYFDALIFSCVEKTAKPDEKIYHIALEKLQSKPEEVVFLDDKRINIEMARKLGINGIIFKNVEQVKEELSVLSVNIK